MNNIMDQPLIFKRQITAVCIVTAINIVALALINSYQIKLVLAIYLLELIKLTFLPSLRGFKFSKYLRYTLFFTVPIIVALVFSHSMIYINTIKSMIYGFVLGAVLLLSNYKYILNIIDKDNPFINVKVQISEIFYTLVEFVLGCIAEELFYRHFIISNLYRYDKILAILVSTFMFVSAHYVNRWSNRMFKMKSYIYHTIIGIANGCLYVVTGSVVGCILSHMIFNSSQLIILYKRYMTTKEVMEENIFNDY